MPKPGNHKKKLSAEAAAAAAPRPEQTRQPTQQRQQQRQAQQQQQQYQSADQRQWSAQAAAATVELGPALDKLAALLPRAVASCRASGAAQAFKLEDALDAVRVAFNRDLASYNEPLALQRCSALLSRRELWLQLLQLACYSSRRLVQSPMDLTDMESLAHTINGINSSQGGSEGGGGGHSIDGLLAGLVADHGLHQAVAAVLTAGVRPAGVATWLAAGAAPPPHDVMGALPTHIACLSARALLQGHTLRVYGRLAATLADSVALQLPLPPPAAATVAAAASTTGTGASAVATYMAPVDAAAAGAGGGGRPMAGVMLDVGWDAPVDICSALQEQQMLTLRICAGSLITDITCLPGEAARPDTSAAATAATDATSNSRCSSSLPPGPPPGPATVAAAVPLQELLFQELAASGFLENTARLAVNCAALNTAGSSSSGSSSGSSSSGGGAAGGSGALPPPYRPAGHLLPTLTAAVDGLRLAVAMVVAPWMQHAVELGAAAAVTLGSRGGGPASGSGTSSQGSGGSSRQALSPRPPLPWGCCLRFLALSQVVVTLEAAGYGGGVRGVWGLPQQLVAGLPVLGLAEEDGGGGNTACDLRGKLRRYAEVQQLVRAARQQQQQPPAGRNQAVGFVLHRGPFELLSQILLVDVVAAKLDDMTATTTSTAKSRCSGSGSSSSSSRSWTFPFSCRALQEVLLGVAEMAAGAPAADTSMRQGEALRPRLCFPQSAAWGIGTAALALARRLQLRAPCSDGDGGGSGGDCWPQMRSRWWRAVVGLLRAEAPYHRRVPSDVAGSFFLTLSKVLLLERMPGLLLPPRAPPGLEAALAAGLLPAVEFALSRTAPDEDAAEIIGAVFQIGPAFASVQSGCSWPQLQQLLAFAAPAQTAALIGSLGKRAHAALHAAEAAKAGQAADAAGCATGAIGAAAAAQQAVRQPARLGGAPQAVLVETRAQQAELCRTVPVACWALVALLPPSPWACLTSSGGGNGGGGGGAGGSTAGAGGVDSTASCEDGSGLQLQLQFLSPQQHLACVASRAHATAAANALRHVDFGWLQAAVALQGGGGGSTGGGTSSSSSSSSSPAAGHEEQCQEQAQEQLLTRTQQVRLLVSQALHSWLPVLSRCVRSPAYLGVQERLAEAPLLQLLLWVQPALLATLNYEADAQLLAAAGPAAAAAGTVVGEAAAEIVAIAAETQRRQLLVPELEMLKAHIYNSFAKTAADIAASWRHFLLRDVDLVAVLEVGLQALSRLPPAAGTHQAGRDLAQCLATALAAAVHAVPDALITVLQPPGKTRPAAAPGNSSRGGRSGSSSGGAGPLSPWGAEAMHGLFRRHVWSSPSATGSSCTVGVGDAARPAGSSGFDGRSGGGRSSLSPSAQLVTCLSFVEELRQAAAAGGTRGSSSGGGSRAAAGPRAGGAPAAAAAAAEATGGTASGILGGLEHRRRRLNLLLLPDRLGGVGAGSAGGGGAGCYAAGRQMLVLPLSPMEAAHREVQHTAGGAGRQ